MSREELITTLETMAGNFEGEISKSIRTLATKRLGQPELKAVYTLVQALVALDDTPIGMDEDYVEE